MPHPDDIKNLSFPELWEVFLQWRIAALEWPLSPKAVFDDVEPIDIDPIFQALVDQRHLTMERLLRNPDPDLSLAFTPGYRDYLLSMENKKADAGWWSEQSRLEWWQGHIDRWLKTFLSYAVRPRASQLPPEPAFAFSLRRNRAVQRYSACRRETSKLSSLFIPAL
jgi:hypothetical protein